MRFILILILVLFGCNRPPVIRHELNLNDLHYIKDERHNICYVYITYSGHSYNHISFTEIDCKKIVPVELQTKRSF